MKSIQILHVSFISSTKVNDISMIAKSLILQLHTVMKEKKKRSFFSLFPSLSFWLLKAKKMPCKS